MPYDIVTGGMGFIASHLAERLSASGRDVIVVDNMDSVPATLPDFHSSMRILNADVRNNDWWKELEHLKISRIFHLAANASVPRSADDPVYDGTTNVIGTLNMLRLARLHDSQFLLTSSAAVYGNPTSIPMSETHSITPVSHYGVSKWSAEQYVNLYRHQFSLDTRIVRFFNVFGPRQSRYLVYDFLTKADLPGNHFEVLGSGKQVRTQLFVQDAVDAVLLVSDHGDSNPYNVGSEQDYTVVDLAKLILAMRQKRKTIRVSGKSWAGDIDILKPDISRVRSLGFSSKISLEEGLLEVMTWWDSK